LLAGRTTIAGTAGKWKLPTFPPKMATHNLRKPPLLQAFIVFFFAFFSISNALLAQTDLEKLPAVILHQDSLFWKAYNECDTAGQRQFFTEDVEFYHDKGGPTKGRETLMANVKKNLCSNENFRLRREVVAGSVQVFPLGNGGVIYGAILSGEHVFYIWGKDKAEYLDGRARFTHVWLLQADGGWKMSRILSYDHRPAVEGKGKN